MRKEKFTCSLNGTHVGQFPTEEEAEEEFEDPFEEEDELTADWTDALPVTEAEAAWAEEEGPVVVGGSLIWKRIWIIIYCIWEIFAFLNWTWISARVAPAA